MKKLITLLLVLTGMVSTASAKTIYFIDNWGRSNLKYEAWTGETSTGDVNLSATTFIGKSDGWFNCYEIDLGDYENFKITHDVYDGRTSTPELSSASFTNGEYYEYYYDGSDSSEKLQPATLYTYSFQVTTAASWDNFNIHIWNSSNDKIISGASWPGLSVTGSGNVYTYIFKSYINTVKVLFNQGSEQPKTGDLSAVPGENKYYISTISTTGGQSFKTNDYGYTTAVSIGNLEMTEGIAYVAEDMGNWAKAYNIEGIGGGIPFLVAGEANTTYCFAWAGSGKDLPCTNAFVKGSNSDLYETDGGGHNYILKDREFYAANGNYVSSEKAYLKLSGTASARVLVFADNETDGINAATTTADNSNVCYNLSGQRIANPTKGLYIRGGKKVIVKK